MNAPEEYFKPFHFALAGKARAAMRQRAAGALVRALYFKDDNVSYYDGESGRFSKI